MSSREWSARYVDIAIRFFPRKGHPDTVSKCQTIETGWKHVPAVWLQELSIIVCQCVGIAPVLTKRNLSHIDHWPCTLRAMSRSIRFSRSVELVAVNLQSHNDIYGSGSEFRLWVTRTWSCASFQLLEFWAWAKMLLGSTLYPAWTSRTVIVYAFIDVRSWSIC